MNEEQKPLLNDEYFPFGNQGNQESLPDKPELSAEEITEELYEKFKLEHPDIKMTITEFAEKRKRILQKRKSPDQEFIAGGDGLILGGNLTPDEKSEIGERDRKF